jgi:hypothetical protein
MVTEKPKKKKIALMMKRGDAPWRMVDARVLSDLAVHRSVQPLPWDRAAIWQVSHVPTGFAVAGHLSEDAALKAMAALRDLDWSFEKPGDMPAENQRRVLEIIKRLKREA